MSRTKQAMRMLDENPGLTHVEAAKAVGITVRAISWGLKNRRETMRMRCPTCDHVLPYLKDVFRKE